MLKFVPNSFVPKSIEERKIVDEAEERQLQLWRQMFFTDAVQMKSIPCIHNIAPANIFPISQRFSKYSSLPYGKIGTVADAGCGPLAVEYALRILGYLYPFEEVLDECVRKGYRAYIYDQYGNIIDGEGTEHSLFHNNAIILQGMQELVKYLQRGCPITLLVNNAIYHEDEERKGNHFVTLVGIDEVQNLIIMDGNLIIDENEPSAALVKKKPWKIASGIKCAWAWEA